MEPGWITTSPLVRTYTLEEFWELPEPPDGSKLELIAGVLFMTPPPEPEHDEIVSRLLRRLILHLEAIGNPGKVYAPRAAIWTGPNTYIEPDLMYISEELRARLAPDRRTCADLVVEVISPSSSIYDRNTKADTYAALGVRELWLVDKQHETVEVRRLEGGRYGDGHVYGRGQTVESDLFPRLGLLVDEIFED
jgi:Uma2 family endonuclease